MPESGAHAVGLKSILKNQYHATLAMLHSAVELCPDDLWVDGSHKNPFWRIVYHTLYYVHLYSRRRVGEFRPWEGHQTGIHDLDDVPASSEIQEFTELPHRPPRTGIPYTKAEILDYRAFCDGMIDAAVDAMDLSSPDSGFSWYPISKMEHQVVALRHIQHHTAQLSDRLRSVTGAGVEWVGRRKS